jgi:hypothetical protein
MTETELKYYRDLCAPSRSMHPGAFPGERYLREGYDPRLARFRGLCAPELRALPAPERFLFHGCEREGKSADIIIPEPGSSQAYDRYAYVNGNPVKYNDPSGHRYCDYYDGNGCYTGGNSSPGEEWEDYVYNVLYNDPLAREETTQLIETVLDTITQTVLSFIAPPVGLFYQTVSEKKVSGLDVAFAFIPTGPVDDFGRGIVNATKKYGDDIVDTTKGFNSFTQLKKSIGSAGENKVWHHIVEQSQKTKSGFSKQMVHYTDNILAVDQQIHQQISGYYSSIDTMTDGKIVREWLATQSFEYQYDFGLKVLRRFGVSK